MRLSAIALLSAAAALTAGAASAQTWASHDGYRPYDSTPGRHYSNPYRYDGRYGGYDRSFNGQADRPGDYRCDAFWDANRSDCGAGWRDQRHRSSYGYGYGHGRGYASGYGYGRGYGSAHGGAGAVYPGAYGRPDLVYPSGRGGYASAGRDPARIDWCRWNYRSYDPASGYYRAYSGRLVWCG